MKQRGTVHHALTACVGVGGVLEAVATSMLRRAWREKGSVVGVAEHLGVHVRTVERLLVAYGLRPRDERKINRRHREAA